MKGIHLLRGYEGVLGGRLLSPLALSQSWYSYYQTRKDEKQRRPWIQQVDLNTNFKVQIEEH